MIRQDSLDDLPTQAGYIEGEAQVAEKTTEPPVITSPVIADGACSTAA
jgi:hypothetical protein